MRYKGNTITLNKDNLAALKTTSAQMCINKNRERSQIILDQICEDLRVTPDKLKYFFNI